MIQTLDEFNKWYKMIENSSFNINGKLVKEFVLEDSNQFMVKFRLQFYRMWKYAREIKERLVRSQKVAIKGL
jgi:hypothetical protein